MEKRASLLSFNDHKIWWEKRIFSLMRKNSQSLSVPLMSFFQRLARPPLIFLPPPLTRPNFILVSPGAPCQLLFFLLLPLSFPHLLLLSFYYSYLFLISTQLLLSFYSPYLFLISSYSFPFLTWENFFPLRFPISLYLYENLLEV